MKIYSKYYRKKKHKIVGNGIVSSLFDRVLHGAASKAHLFSKVDKKNLLDTASGVVNQILANSGKSTKSVLKKTASYLRRKLKRGQKMRLKRRIFGARRKRKKMRGGGAPALYSLNRYYKKHLARRGRQILRRRRQKKAGIAPVRRRRRRRAKSRISQLQLYRLGLNLGRARSRRRRKRAPGRRKRAPGRANRRRKRTKGGRKRRRRGPRKKFDIRNFVKRKRKPPTVKVGGAGALPETPSVFNI